MEDKKLAEAIVIRGALFPSGNKSVPSLYGDHQRIRLEELQLKIYKLRLQIYQANNTQGKQVAMALAYVDIYHQEMNDIILEACGLE